MSASFHSVPVVDVSVENLQQVWPLLLDWIKTSSFIAVDTELSGIGERKKLISPSVEDRYRYICDVAKTRSILSLGISLFKKKNQVEPESQPENESDTKPEKQSESTKTHFEVQTFNVWVLCMDNFVVEPASLKFLVDHGFDFNKQYSQGIPFTRGSEKESHNYKECSLRNLFLQLILSQKPVVVHNGLLDLVFLYQNFYGELPGKLQVFTADLAEMFPGGILDTKYIAEFHAREPASYLGYIFKKSQRGNAARCSSGQGYVAISMSNIASLLAWTEELSCSTQADPVNPTNGTKAPCPKYMAHGFCPQGKECVLSHDLDVILDHEESLVQAKRKKRKRKRKQSKAGVISKVQELTQSQDVENAHASKGTPSSEENSLEELNISSPVLNQTRVKTRNCGHRAGFDAFMTGYCLATYLVQHGKSPNGDAEVTRLDMAEFVNRVSLNGKNVPLQITCSHFVRPSASHSDKLHKAKEMLHD